MFDCVPAGIREDCGKICRQVRLFKCLPAETCKGSGGGVKKLIYYPNFEYRQQLFSFFIPDGKDLRGIHN